MVKLLRFLLFGKTGIDGYYTPPVTPQSKNYVLDSVFPDRDTMERALAVVPNESGHR